jgi:hypothetical protein
MFRELDFPKLLVNEGQEDWLNVEEGDLINIGRRGYETGYEPYSIVTS